jgi:60 kDa SS-A/Ro ribonucleoprotein
MLSCTEGIAVMALATAKVESAWKFEAFDVKLYPLSISPRQRLDDVLKAMQVGGGGTNCSLSIQNALASKQVYDAIVVYTDNETWSGNQHPQQAFEEYLSKVNPNAKLIVVAMTSTHMSIGDRNHPSILNIVGFDTSTPQVISEFVKGF